MLCKLVGWGSFRCEGLYPAKEMNDWVLRQRRDTKVLKFPEQPVQPIQQDEQPVRKKRGWPKGKPRKPRYEQKTEVQVDEELFVNWKQMSM